MEVFWVLLGQVGMTWADATARRNVEDLRASRPRPWMLRYLATRLGGLTMRLVAIASLPIGVAATLQSAAAVGASAIAGHRGGERFEAREVLAMTLVVVGVACRSFL